MKTVAFFCYLLLQTGNLFAQSQVKIGAERLDVILNEIGSKKIGLVVNHSSMVANTHLVDTLLSQGVSVEAIFAPEHGFTGKVERGENISNSEDKSSGAPIYSIYGKSKKPSVAQLESVDIMLFDIQDVGTRFFTYISTIHYVMEACAENNIPFIILDRPNPLDHYIDGPILEPNFNSFIGMHPVPIVHAMTIGEYARMINGEGWLKGGIRCDLKVIEMEQYMHGNYYQLSTNPSPNLPDMKSIYMYPSICLFEGTEVSEGRGTYKPFQQFGTPTFKPQKHVFIPEPIPGLSAKPKFEGEECFGYNFSNYSLEALQNISMLNLEYLIEFYNQSPNQPDFFTKHFDLLAGNDQLKKKIIAGMSSQEIRKSWQPGIQRFVKTREKYLLYQ